MLPDTISPLFTSGGQSIGASASALVLPMNVQGWFPLGLTGLISLLSKGLARVFSSTQLKSIISLTRNLLYGPTHIRTWLLEKPYRSLISQTFVSKVMSLLFNMLSRFVIDFLPRSKHLLISWLQSSAVILEPKKIKSQICRWHHSYDRKWRGHWRASWWRWKRRVKNLA